MLKPGTYVGRYRVEAFVEQGGMGEVFHAFDPMLEREVALKSIRLDLRRDFAALERFQREAKTLAQLNHPGICQVYDWIEAEGATYMAMEWVPGVSLAQEILKPLPLPRILDLLESIAGALGGAHAHQIVHRDLKPANILLLPDGGVKVLDFGLAKSVEEAAGMDPAFQTGPTVNLRSTEGEYLTTQSLPAPSGTRRDSATQAGAIVGTLGYLSPEQANRLPIGPPSDIFALGILAHELLTGRKPFEGTGLASIQAVARNERIPLPPLRSGQRWPRALVRLLDRMLRPSPGRRMTAEQVVEALKTFRRPLSRAWTASLAVATTLALVGGAYLFGGRSVISDLTRERPARIAILPLANGTGDPRLEAVIRVAMPDMLGAALQESPRLEIIDPEAVARACEAQKIDPGLPLEKAQAQRLARTLGARLFLVGGIARDFSLRRDSFSFSLLDPLGRVRHRGLIHQQLHADFLPTDFLSRSSASLIKAVDPLGTGASTAPAPQVPPQALKDFAQGMAHYYKGDYRKAEPHLMQCAYAAPHLVRAVASYARCLQRLSKSEALPAAQWALLAAQKARDHGSEAGTLLLMSDLARERGDHPLARTQLERALELARLGRDQDRESACWKALGTMAQGRTSLEEAEACFQKAVQLARATGNRRFEADYLTNLANLALERGTLPQAETNYREILAIFQSIENRSGEALALNNLGVFLMTARRLAEVEAPLQQALQIRIAIGDGRGEANTLRNLGILYQMKGSLPEARLTQQRALERAKQLEYPLGQAHSLYRLADLDRLEGRFKAACQGFQTAAVLFEPRGSSTERADALASAAECLARLRPPRLEEAAALLEQAQGDKPPRTTALRARAWIHWAGGRPLAALRDLESALRDPGHQAPEGRTEMAETLALFRGKNPS